MTIFLGTKEIDHSEVSIDGQTRRKHLTIFGKSGTGKTTLIRNAVTADLHTGNGVTVIDPHGSSLKTFFNPFRGTGRTTLSMSIQLIRAE